MYTRGLTGQPTETDASQHVRQTWLSIPSFEKPHGAMSELTMGLNTLFYMSMTCFLNTCFPTGNTCTSANTGPADKPTIDPEKQ